MDAASSETLKGSSESSASESSELSPLTPKRRSSMLRRRSSVERIVVGIKRAFAAFEYEVTQEPIEVESDDTEISSDDEYERNGDNENRKVYRHFCFGVTLLSVLLGISYGLGFWTSTSKSRLDYGSRSDPIMALKENSSLEGLQNAAVAADHELCSEVGNSILLDGGNAVDAAVAAALCLGIANPSSSGLGGGAFILIHSDKANHEARARAGDFPDFIDARDPNMAVRKDKVTEVIDCRETAPNAATQDMYLSTPDAASTIGGLAVAVPGELRGLELAHARHGKLPWRAVLNPAMKIARQGVPISQHLALMIKIVAEKNMKEHREFPMLRRYLTKSDKWETYLKEGELLKNPKLAETLDLVAQVGSGGFYNGELAKSLVKDVAAEGGILTEEDMANYLPTLRSPVFADASGFTVVGVPPPSSGGATLIGVLRFLSGYRDPLASFPDTLSVHRMVEALRHAFAIRMSLSDPGFYANKTMSAVHDLVSGSYMEVLRKSTRDNDTLPLSMYGGKWAQLHDTDGEKAVQDAHEGDRRLRRPTTTRRLARPFGYLEDSGTSSLSVVDKEGNAVAITSSVNQILGSYVFSESTGVLLGNTMDDFGNPGRSNFYGLKPAEENFIAPGKKPLSSMSPTMVFRKTEGADDDTFGKLELVVGGSGGPKIISSVVQVVINYCLLGMPLFDSIARPRVHDQLVYHDAALTTTEKMLLLEGPLIEVPQRTKDALLARGHDSLLEIDYAGTVQAVAVDLETNNLSAVSDIRKGGRPAGH